MASSNEARAAEDGGILAVLVASSVIGGILFVLFFFVRVKFKHILSPREDAGFFGWLPRTVTVTREEMFEQGGFHAHLFTTFMQSLIILVFFMMIIGCGVIMPVNYLGKNAKKGGIYLLSITNIDQDRYLWAHIAATAIFSVGSYIFIILYQRSYLKSRAKYLTSKGFTLEVNNIPKENTTKEVETELRKIFTDLSGNAVVAVHASPHAPRLVDYLKQHESYRKNLIGQEAIRDELGRTPMMRTGSLALICFWRKKVEAIPYIQARMAELEEAIVELQSIDMPFSGTAFVSLNGTDVVLKMIYGFWYKRDKFLKPVRSHPLQPTKWRVVKAPSVGDMLWHNIDSTTRHRLFTSIITMLFTIVLAFLWAVPISILSSSRRMAGLPVVGFLFEWLLRTHYVVQSFFDTYAPVILVAIFFAILPKILMAISKVEKHHAKSHLETSVGQKFYIFIFFNILLFRTIMSGTYDFLVSMTGDSASSGEPAVSFEDLDYVVMGAFFVNYMIAGALLGCVIQLFRLGDLIPISLKLRLLGKTSVARERALRLKEFKYYTWFPYVCAVFSMTLMFSIALPLVLPAGFLLLLLRYLVGRNIQIAGTFRDDGDGFIIQWVLQFILSGVLLFQATMTSIFFFKRFWTLAALSAALIPFTAILMVYLVVSFFFADRFFAKNAVSTGAKPPDDLATMYVSPALVPFNGLHLKELGARESSSGSA